MLSRSPISRYLLNPFWNWFVTLWPLWVAPNTVRLSLIRSFREVTHPFIQITLTGLGIVFFNFCTLLFYDPLYLTEKESFSDPPAWIYYT